MSFTPGFRSRILIGDFSMSAVTNKVSSQYAFDVYPVDVFDNDGSKAFIVGQDTSTLTVSGLLDTSGSSDAYVDQMNDWRSNEPITVGVRGLTLGRELTMVSGLKTQWSPDASESAAVTFDLAAQTDGRTDIGVSLHDLVAVTTDASGSSVDNAASTPGGGAGHLHVTAFSGLTNVIVKVQHSADDSTYADLITFATATGITSERATVTGTVNRYVRCTWDVTGSGSVTFSVGFARR